MLATARGLAQGLRDLLAPGHPSLYFDSSFPEEGAAERAARHRAAAWLVGAAQAAGLPAVYAARPQVVLYGLAALGGLALFALLLLLQCALRGTCRALALGTGLAVFQGLVEIEDVPDALPENPFWAGTHSRRREQELQLASSSKED